MTHIEHERIDISIENIIEMRLIKEAYLGNYKYNPIREKYWFPYRVYEVGWYDEFDTEMKYPFTLEQLESGEADGNKYRINEHHTAFIQCPSVEFVYITGQTAKKHFKTFEEASEWYDNNIGRIISTTIRINLFDKTK